jgi:Uma2 family endonuclease
MVQTPVKSMTLEAFLALPETKPASESVNGRIIRKPMPQGQHSVIQRQLLFAISPILSQKGIAEAFPELRCTFGGQSIVPNVAVFETSRIPSTEDGEIANVFTLAPDWTIEILSPGQSSAKVLKNISHCLTHGAQMGWLIDPSDRSVIAVQAGQLFTVIDEPKAVLPVPKFATSIELTVEQLFGWIKKKVD